ncbi:MAG: 4-hydroxy-tetrahydrodipicolinate synthase [Thermoproteota archaeon]|nr:4-hydroxy-tetrahydrodipicolinate synthase [Candidatus Brockarchaeota archaeon]MBO3767949.1 4-hydroxy-tetrahydrodipicolinate synthase [Candidatus Brockarchaeota archaeon]MBO3802011.1 4-hydroxy-tetrahydrodipicolinate synthase [Candidatus Brockarchaeota archaeon]
MKSTKIFTGVFPPTITIFDSNDEINYELTKKHIDFLISNGADGIIVEGSTGEFFNLNDQERKKLIEEVVIHVGGRVPVIAGVSSCSTKNVIELSKFAEKVGADGLLITPPYYYKPNEEELFNHFKLISKTVDIPIMLYNNPWTTGVYVRPPLLVRMANEGIIQYVKETHGDVAYVHETYYIGKGKPTIFFGKDENSLEAFLVGAVGWVSGAANVTIKLQKEMYNAFFKDGNIQKAKEIYFKLIPWFLLTERRGRWISYVKGALNLIGHNVGAPRLPLLSLSTEELNEVKKVIEAIPI